MCHRENSCRSRFKGYPMKLKSPFLIKPHSHTRLAKLLTTSTRGYKSEEASAAILTRHRADLDALQNVLYASQKKSVLIVIQGMDTAGKDGTIRHIFSGMNPQGCDVTSFKVPTPLEARHDFLWRAHAAVPPRGMVGIFNRSHYEDVLSPFVHNLITPKTMDRRLDDINKFENMLVDNDVVILKFFLHISRDEQTRRLQSRIDDPRKHWKLSDADIQI
jgi:PPK2 family polyphosphate:nucleotide phosphotransferase